MAVAAAAAVAAAVGLHTVPAGTVAVAVAVVGVHTAAAEVDSPADPGVGIPFELGVGILAVPVAGNPVVAVGIAHVPAVAGIAGLAPLLVVGTHTFYQKKKKGGN